MYYSIYVLPFTAQMATTGAAKRPYGSNSHSGSGRGKRVAVDEREQVPRRYIVWTIATNEKVLRDDEMLNFIRDMAMNTTLCLPSKVEDSKQYAQCLLDFYDVMMNRLAVCLIDRKHGNMLTLFDYLRESIDTLYKEKHTTEEFRKDPVKCICLYIAGFMLGYISVIVDKVPLRNHLYALGNMCGSDISIQSYLYDGDSDGYWRASNICVIEGTMNFVKPSTALTIVVPKKDSDNSQNDIANLRMQLNNQLVKYQSLEKDFELAMDNVRRMRDDIRTLNSTTTRLRDMELENSRLNQIILEVRENANNSQIQFMAEKEKNSLLKKENEQLKDKMTRNANATVSDPKLLSDGLRRKINKLCRKYMYLGGYKTEYRIRSSRKNMNKRHEYLKLVAEDMEQRIKEIRHNICLSS